MSTSRELILHVGNGTTVQMDSPTTFGAIVTKIKIVLNLKRFDELSDIVKIHKLVFYKASGKDEFGCPLTADECANTVQITADNVYWRKAIKVHSYGERVGKGISSKHHLCLIFDSWCPNYVTEQLNSFENKFDNKLALSEAADASKKQPPKVGGPLRIVCIPINQQSDRAVPAEAASVKDFLLHNAQSTSGDYMLFYVADKAQYSHTTEYQIRKLMHLPAVSGSAGTDYCDRLLSTMTDADLQRFQGHVEGYLGELKANRRVDSLSTHQAGPPHDLESVVDQHQSSWYSRVCRSRWNSCVRLCFDHLFALQPHFAVLSIYNEATRRVIVNEIMQAATMYCNGTLGVEEIVWKQSNSMKFENVCGYGPLDYSTSTTSQSALEMFADTRGVVYDTVADAAGATADVPKKRPRDDKLSCSPVSCSYATLPPYTPTPYGRTVALPPSNPISSSSSNSSFPSGFRAVFKMGPLFPSEQISHAEQKKEGMDVNDEDVDIEEDDIDDDDDEEEEGTEQPRRPFSINVNSIPLSQPPEEKKLFKTLSEAKRLSVVMKLLKSLWQTLGELHDLHLDPCTEVSSSVGTLAGSSSETDQPQNARISHRTVFGTLTSGQTFHFFRSFWPEGENMPTVTYLGRLTLSVLIYDNNKDGQPDRVEAKLMKRNDGTAAVTSSAPVTAEADEQRLISGVGKDNLGEGYSRVSYEQFERVVAATVMMMEGSLRGAKELL
eukprot:gene10925-12144_t